MPGVHPIDGGHAVAEGQVFVVGFVLQRAGVDLVSRSRRRAAVSGALQEVVAVALDAANDAICAASPVNNLDQRGIIRPVGPQCDIGAYEGTLANTFLPTIMR